MLENERMRKASGEVTDSRPLVAFLYLLARDQLAIGKIESLVDEACKPPGTEKVFTNGWLANWAKDAVDRLEVHLQEIKDETT